MRFGLFRAAAIAVPVCLAAAGAVAQNVVTVPPGMVVVVLPGAPGATVTRMPARPVALERMFAEQRAMMARMMADMNAMFGAPSPMSGPMRMVASPGAGAVVCQERISVTFGGGDAKPLVRVSRAGDCGGPSAGTPAAVPAEIVPSAPPPVRPRVLEVNEPVPMSPPPVRHRT